MSAAAGVIERAVAVATITAARGPVAAIAYERMPVATVAGTQGPAGRDGKDGAPGPPGQSSGYDVDPGDLTLIFENRLV